VARVSTFENIVLVRRYNGLMTRDILEPILNGLFLCLILTPIVLFGNRPHRKRDIRAIIALWAVTVLAVAVGAWRYFSNGITSP
jgi:hypothetical protein